MVFIEADFAEEGFCRVHELKNLKQAYVYSCRNADQILIHLQGMSSIEEIRFETFEVSEEGLKVLASFPNLKKVQFEQVMSDKEIELLKATLPNVTLRIPPPEPAEPR